MKNNNPFNLFIAGIGGQGIVTLTKTVWDVCNQNSIMCKGSILKGGAQTLGSVQAIIRIFFTSDDNYSFYSPEIPKGELNLLLGLEPWEALRQFNLFSKDTKIILNEEIVPLWSERHKKIKIENPISELKNLDIQMISKNYTEIAKEKYQSPKMANFEILLDAIDAGYLKLPKKPFLKAMKIFE